MKFIPYAFLLCFLLGCSIPNGPCPTNGVSTTVSDCVREQLEQAKEISNSHDKIGDSLISIDGHAESILDDVALVPHDKNFNIGPTLDSIEDSAEAIREDVDSAQKEQIRIEEALEDLDAANHRVSSALTRIIGLEQEVESYKESDREVRREALENLHFFITLFFVIGFGMLVGGAFIAFWVNGKLGGVILAIGVLTVGFAAASQYYLEEIAVVGLVVLIIGFLATAGVIGWMLLRGKNNEKAIAEIVELIEETKDHLTIEERQEIFGRDGFASRMTSDLTKKIIAQVKIKNGFKNLTRNK